jgi:hypothetical protein
MNTTTILLLSALNLLIVFSACNREDEFPDPDYPTKIEELTEKEISSIISRLQQTPLAGCVSIDHYGFPFIVPGDECINPEWETALNDDEIRELAHTALDEYASFLNLPDNANYGISSISTLGGTAYDNFIVQFPDSVPSVWMVSTTLQRFNGIEIRGTNIRLLINNDGAIGISGQWYDNVYIPVEKAYTEEEAKGLLLGKTFKHNTASIIPNESTNWHESKEIILPIRRKLNVELHLCYALFPGGWEILVDKYTGEVLSSIKIS